MRLQSKLHSSHFYIFQSIHSSIHSILVIHSFKVEPSLLNHAASRASTPSSVVVILSMKRLCVFLSRITNYTDIRFFNYHSIILSFTILDSYTVTPFISHHIYSRSHSSILTCKQQNSKLNQIVMSAQNISGNKTIFKISMMNSKKLIK